MKQKVLVVDDDQATLEAIQMILTTEGYAVDTSVNGNCLLHLNGALPDLILLDIVLTGEDGRDLCQQLKQREDTRYIPIILYSGQITGDIMTYLSGASTFLAKPFDMRDLIKIIARYIALTQAIASSPDDTAALLETLREG